MGKLDDLMKSTGANAAESMGAGRERGPMNGSSAPVVRRSWTDAIHQRSKAAEILLEKIVPDPSQPRREFPQEELERLAQSLKDRGQIQPIVVLWDEAAGKFVIVCGERRWRAAALAGRTTVSAIVLDRPIEPKERLAMQLIENCLREDLKPIEQAHAFRTLMDANGWSTHQCAAELAIDQSSVVKTLKLLELPEPVQEMVQAGEIPPATGYELTKVDDPVEQQALAEKVARDKLSREETKRRVQQKAKGRGGAKAKGKAKDKGQPRLPAEIKHRGTYGSRVVVKTVARHGPHGLIADLHEIFDAIRKEFADRSREQMQPGSQDAA
jgi:ParB family chromosome partitioning protein